MRALLVAVLAVLSGCAWERATFGDPPGPIRQDWSAADSAGHGSENQHGYMTKLDAGAD